MLKKYIFAGDSTASVKLFVEFASHFGSSASETVASIARKFGLGELAGEEQECEILVSMQRFFGEETLLTLETVSAESPDTKIFEAIIKKLGLEGKISVTGSQEG